MKTELTTLYIKLLNLFLLLKINRFCNESKGNLRVGAGHSVSKPLKFVLKSDKYNINKDFCY